MRRRKFLALLSGTALWPIAIRAQQTDYPSRAVRIVVGFGAGGGTDTVARIVAHKLQDTLGGAFVVENRPGGSGRLAPDLVAKATPDGYTLLGAAPGAMSVGAAIWPDIPYDIFKDFAPISLIAEYTLVVLVAKSHPAKTVTELVAWLKANPDKANYPTPSPVFTLPIEHFKIKTGAPATAINYKSSNESIASLLGGQTAFAFVETPIAVPQLGNGLLRALAVTATARIRELPDVPTLAEAGVPDVLGGTYLAMMAPAGTPAPIVATLADAANKAMHTPDAINALHKQGYEPLAVGPDEFAAHIRSDVARWTKVVRAAGLKK
jgi:tripartite-type tricarboxylate transporter receptor subunit TctC